MKNINDSNSCSDVADKSKSKKRKNNIASSVVMIFLIVIGAMCGVSMVKFIEEISERYNYEVNFFLVLILITALMYAAMFLSIIIHEAGHLVFGLLSGYKFNSFRIMNLMFIKDNGRMKLKTFKLAGTSGQCLMNPPDLVDGHIPVVLSNLGGSIMNLIVAVTALVVRIFVPVNLLWTVVLSVFMIINLAFAVINGIPIKMGNINNDGRNTLDLIRNKEAVRAFWIQFKLNEMNSENVRLKDMPEEWFVLPDESSMENGIIASVAVFAANRLMDSHKFEEADRLMKQLLSKDNGIIGAHRGLMICDRLFIELISENRKDMIEKLYTKEQQKFMKTMGSFISVARTGYVYALFNEKDDEKIKKCRARFEKIAKNWPYNTDAQSERELVAIAESRLEEVNG